MRFRSPFPYLLLSLAILSGCHKSGEPFKPVAAATLAPGWTKARDAESGLSLAMPPGWRVGMPRGQGGGFATGGGYSSNPGVADMIGGGGGAGVDPAARGGMPEGENDPNLQAARAAAERKALAELRKTGVLIQAVNDASGTMGEEPTRFYLQEYKDCGGLEALKAQEKDSLSNEGAGKAVDLPVGKGWMYENKGQNRIGDIERHVSYLVCDGATGYALRFVATNNPTVFDAFHAEVARSLRKGK